MAARLLSMLLLVAAALARASSLPVSEWSAKFRNWTYYPSFVVPPDAIKGATLVDCSIAWEVPESTAAAGAPRYRMFYTFFDGVGYRTALARSADLVSWDFAPGVVFSQSENPEAFDYGGVTFGGGLWTSPNLTAPRTLLPIHGRYYVLYGAYPVRGGYEQGAGADGVASCEALEGDGGECAGEWEREGGAFISTTDKAVQGWESECIYEPFLVYDPQHSRFWNFYNARGAQGTEQSGASWVSDAFWPGVPCPGTTTKWQRLPENPILPNGEKGSYDQQMASDPKVYRDGDHWVMLYFGGLRDGHADIMAAFSEDLVHWEKDPVPLYLAGGHPEGLDAEHAHKVSVIYRQDTQTLYMFYTAVGKQGRGIALLTSKPLA